MPEGTTVNPNHYPSYAHKEELIVPETPEDIKAYIEKSGFTSKTRNDLLVILSGASGKEFRTANYNLYQGQENYANFKISMIELEVRIPREERERKEFETCCTAILKVYADNLSQCIRDEYGRNVFWAQYVEESLSRSYSETKETGHMTNVAAAQGHGFSLKGIPVIGGFLGK